ncbi:MAG: DEAD/DEAH box helicase, partial [Erythrobacter sp.]|nr:DEAD/DEAH box helicase [Erythrobacter sp.]
MDRALSLDLLNLALGETANLPSPEEFAETMALAEAELFRGNQTVPESTLATAWYLHSVGSALGSLELYGVQRRRAAFQVAGHIFDLALADPVRDELERLRLTFAAQVSNLRGGLNPNALAAYRWRLDDRRMPDYGTPTTSLEIGTALLANDTNWLFPAFDRLRSVSAQISRDWDVDPASTAFAALDGVVDGGRRLLLYLVYGDEDNRAAARERLRAAAASASGPEDIDSRWVAFHLSQIADELGGTSVWALIPPDTSPSVARAFTLARPPILSLWPPQVSLLDPERTPSPLDPAVKRIVLSVPTSAGKTLLAQLLVADHLTRIGSGACFVAPTRSLCREIEASLRQRLRLLAAPAEVAFTDDLHDVTGDGDPQVEVMTPERLAYLLRTDSASVLERFGLFVFDEAHSVGDGSRGWTLEWVMSFLHGATIASSHRIVAMSAAIGNRATLATWLDPTALGVHFHSEWRGPRRVHSIYRTERIDDSATELPRPTSRSPMRTRYDLRGVLHLRPTATGRVFELRTRTPVGQLVVRQPGHSRDSELSTPFYRTIAPIALMLGRAGPVLLISPTKNEARLLAGAIADRSSYEGPAWLVAMAQARLGADHPLIRCLRRGVAYHHSSLPRDVLLGIEESVSTERLQFVVATTTLTEGVNLPVRTVIITAQGTYGQGG